MPSPRVSVLLLGLISVGVCYPTLFTGKSWVPWDYYTNLPLFGGPLSRPVDLANYRQYDIIESNFNHDAMIRQAALAGEPLLWDPYHFFGQPIHAQAGTAPLYPVKWMVYPLFEADTAFSIFLWLHLWLSGAAMRFLALRLGISPRSALLAGVTWMLCAKSAVLFKYSNILPHLAWLPIVFALCVEPTWRRAMLGSIALALAMLGGHHYYQVASSVFLGLFLLTRGRAHAAKFAVMIAAALVMCSPQILPAARLILDGDRADFTAPDFGWPLKQTAILATLVFPKILGGPVDRANLFKEWGIGNEVELQVYVGLFPLVGLLVAVAAWRRSPARFFVVGAAAVLLLLLVRPLSAALHAVIPVESQLNPVRVSYLFAFCASIAAAAGLDRLSANPALARALWKAAVAGALLTALGSVAMGFTDTPAGRWLGPLNAHIYRPILFMIALAASLRLVERGRPGIVVGMTFAELGLFFISYNTTYPVPLVPDPQLTEVHDRVADNIILPDIGTPHSNLVSLYGIRGAGGYDSFLSGRYARWAREYGAGGRQVHFPIPGPVGRMGVRYALTDRETFIPGSRPRAFMTGETVAVPDGDAALAAVRRGEVPVETSGPLPAGSPEVFAPFGRDGFNIVEVLTGNGVPTLLVLCDSYHPDWICLVDGVETPILRANYLHRGVILPAGTQRVEFRYVPRLLYGCLIAAGLALACVLTAIVGLTRSGRA